VHTRETAQVTQHHKNFARGLYISPQRALFGPTPTDVEAAKFSALGRRAVVFLKVYAAAHQAA
jgi:hypothetical protein